MSNKDIFKSHIASEEYGRGIWIKELTNGDVYILT